MNYSNGPQSPILIIKAPTFSRCPCLTLGVLRLGYEVSLVAVRKELRLEEVMKTVHLLHGFKGCMRVVGRRIVQVQHSVSKTLVFPSL